MRGHLLLRLALLWLLTSSSVWLTLRISQSTSVASMLVLAPSSGTLYEIRTRDLLRERETT